MTAQLEESPIAPIKELSITHELVYDSHGIGYEPKELVGQKLITPKVKHEDVDYFDGYHLLGKMDGYTALIIEQLYQTSENASIIRSPLREPGFLSLVDNTIVENTHWYPNYHDPDKKYHRIYVPRYKPDFVLIAACLQIPKPQSLGLFSSSWLFHTHFRMGDVLSDIRSKVTGVKSKACVDYALHQEPGFRVFISNPTLERQERIPELGKLVDILFADKNFSKAVELRQKLEWGTPYDIFVSNPTKGITKELQAKNYTKLIKMLSNRIKSNERLLNAVDLL